MPKVHAHYRLAGGRRNLAGGGQLKILDCQQHLGFVGGRDVQAVGEEPGFQVEGRPLPRPVPRASCLRNSGEIAVSGLALRMVCQAVPRLPVALDGLDIGAVVAAAVDKVVPPAALRGRESADKQAFRGLLGLPNDVEMASNISAPSFTAQAPGSSAITQGVLTRPIVVLGLLDRTCSTVRVGL